MAGFTKTAGGGFLSGTFGRDFAASFVVFLVAMPLCLGIAIASGVPPALGLVTGIIGGIVVGSFAGAPLQVSGPAAGLAVLVFDLVQRHGLAALGPVVLLAGIIQFAGGLLKLGRYFRGVSPAVVHGMLAGIGAVILLQQIHVLVDDRPRSDGIANLVAIPDAFLDLGGSGLQALIVGLVTIAATLAWDRFKPGSLRLLPGALIGVVAGTLVAVAGSLSIQRISLPSNLAAEISFPTAQSLSLLADPAMIGLALAFAFIASAETLLSAAAVDKMQDRVQSKFDKELSAQGVGNFLCGLVGALPMTGVIVRSSANVQAGAMTRASTIMHGFWILGFVSLLPFVLSLVPTASLAGVLVVVGAKLIKVKDVQGLFARYGPFPALIWAVTFVLVVTTDLLTGVVVGLALTALELLPQVRGMRLSVEEQRYGEDDHEVVLEGKATAVAIRKVAALIDRLPNHGRLRLDFTRLRFADHTVSELMADAVKRRRDRGVDVEVEHDDTPHHRRLASAMT
ncbi:SulP family inorganic anion transporter [Stakelama sp. CBK3Z-3]|uniref:SulP family inorganic anion transporter n=1 Tax=Stakelama flava TaxID=2860338 RepID=A0ABS6XHQ8_9SPHN|nr:SulP family inorganic anion transporter [Stakelama flava]MBW4329750.1 SulP family inorganic anion transporter [Stakelama flava]